MPLRQPSIGTVTKSAGYLAFSFFLSFFLSLCFFHSFLSFLSFFVLSFFLSVFLFLSFPPSSLSHLFHWLVEVIVSCQSSLRPLREEMEREKRNGEEIVFNHAYVDREKAPKKTNRREKKHIYFSKNSKIILNILSFFSKVTND